jgi:hypothetical protein
MANPCHVGMAALVARRRQYRVRLDYWTLPTVMIRPQPRPDHAGANAGQQQGGAEVGVDPAGHFNKGIWFQGLRN